MEYTSSVVQKKFGINRNTFQDWLDRGFISPSIQKSTKQGETNIFSRGDMYRIFLFSELIKVGLDRKTAVGFALMAQDYDKKKISSDKFNIHHLSIYIRYSSKKNAYETFPGAESSPKGIDFNKNDFVIVINLDSIMTRADKLIEG